MAIGWLLLGVVLIVAGFAGLVLPMLPGMPLILAGSLAVAAADGFERVGALSLAVIAVLALAGSIVDHVSGVLGARRAGASRWGLLGAVLGLIVGLFFGLPGLILGPAIGAVTLEYARDQEFRRATRAGAGVFIGFVLGTVLKYTFACAALGVLIVAYLY